MPCYHPLKAHQPFGGGPLVFGLPVISPGYRAQMVKCGHCIGCRLEYSRQTAVRCMHEASMHSQNCFLTLTYRDALPGQSLVYKDYQDFIKRVRARFVRARGNDFRMSYYVAGEYGELFYRPHFHSCNFGIDFEDKVLHTRLSSGFDLYRSAELEELWPHGFSSIGELNFETAAYVARYCVKKLSGIRVLESSLGRIDLETGEILPAVREFCHWSLKPGIGRRWLERFTSDVYPRGETVGLKGRAARAPRYYDKWYSKFDLAGFERLKERRAIEALAWRHDQTWSRLQVREQVAAARASFLKRPIDGG